MPRSRLWYDLNYGVSFVGMTLGFSLRTEGRRHIPPRGPALVIANHQSFLDPLVVGLAARRRLRFLARKTLFRHAALAWYMSSLNAVPIDQDGTGIDGLRVGVKLLREGHGVVVFPEGSRTPDGSLHPLKPGIALLLKRAPAPVIPVGIAGAYDAWPIWRKYPIPAPLFLPPWKGTIAASIGPPIDPARLNALPREQLVAELLSVLQKMHARAERLRRK